MWILLKAFFFDRLNFKEISTITNNGEFLSRNSKIAGTFSRCFSNVVPSLNIPREKSLLNMNLCLKPILTAREKYKR